MGLLGVVLLFLQPLLLLLVALVGLFDMWVVFSPAFASGIPRRVERRRRGRAEEVSHR